MLKQEENFFPQKENLTAFKRICYFWFIDLTACG